MIWLLILVGVGFVTLREVSKGFGLDEREPNGHEAAVDAVDYTPTVDPNNGRRLILRITGLNAYLYCRRFDTKMARLRGIYWWLVRRYETELCQHCGRPVRLVYHAPDWVWETVTGNARHPDGHSAPGILCPPCLDDLAEAKGLPFLRWTCATDDTVMYG